MKYPDATGYLRGLNTFARLRPELADFLENRFFRTVDNQAALVLQMLLQDKVDFDQKMQCAWSRFLMTLLHRHPEGMKRIGGKVAAGFPGELEDAVRASYARLRQDGDPATYEEFRSTITDADIDQVHLLVLHKVMDSENVGTVLNRLRWAVIQIDDTHHRLLTSDRPMLMTNGLAQADAHILMPISPNRIFVAARNVGVVRQIHAKIEHRGGVQVLNNHIVRQARSYVYAIDEAALPFMEHRLGEQAKSSPLD
jgi:hypothetical protein